MLTSTTTPMPSSHTRRPSRSNSASSSSIVTVQRTASRQSRSGSRSHLNRTNTSSPVTSGSKGENGFSTPTPPAPDTTRHNQWNALPSTQDRPTSVGGVREGVGSLNRWSQSTSSSKNSPPNNTSEALQEAISHRASVANSLTGSLHSLKNLAQSSPPRTSLAQIRQSPTKTSPTSSTAPWLGDQSPTAPSEIITLPTPPDVDLSNLSGSIFSSINASTSGSVESGQWVRDSSPDKTNGTGHHQGHSVSSIKSQARSEATSTSAYASGHKHRQPSHSRSRSRDPTGRTHRSRSRQNGSRGHAANDSSSSAGGEKGHRTQSHKTMLSKALQKANTAVLLDNAANFEGAIEAYTDACHLLQQVMQRTNGEEKQKLEEIRSTYSSRILELKRLDIVPQQPEGKALPERPLSDESLPGEAFSTFGDDDIDEDTAVIETATATRIVNNPSYKTDPWEPRTLAPSQIPPRRQSLLPSPMTEESRFLAPSPNFTRPEDRFRSNPSKQEDRTEQRTLHIPAPADDYLPSPLSPRRYSPPHIPPRFDSAQQHPSRQAPTSNPTSNPSNFLTANKRHSRDTSNESTSWLDTIDESGPSSNSSLHSRSSSLYLRRKQARGSNGTEAEFDAALDAAVEAAYDQGFVPDQDEEEEFEEDDVLTNAKRNVELAKQRVREAEREAEDAFRGRHRHIPDGDPYHQHEAGLDSEYMDDEAEEEERLLEEMTQGYVMDDFEFGLQSKSALPRQSDSSGFSGRTWGSSVGSNTLTTGTSLSTLAEGVALPSLDSQIQSKQLSRPSQPPPPPPASTLPPAPPLPSTSPPALPLPSIPSTPSPSGFGSPSTPGVRARRLSGQNTKQLRIDTNTNPNATSYGPKSVPLAHPPTNAPPPIPKDEPKTSVPTTRTNDGSLTPGKPPLYLRTTSVEPPQQEPSTPSLGGTMPHDYDVPPSPSNTIGKVASAPDNLRKNISSSSLKALRTRNMSLSAPDEHSPSTPSSAMFTGIERKGTISQTSQPTSSGSHHHSQSARAMYLFGNDIHSPTTPGSPNPQATNAPLPLEPCPESFLLRPFWLARALYQTIAHPRGGYLSTKLFIPRDVWNVKNVKLKAIEEKISACDLLTAALLKLSQVDTYDADAVLEEMQAFENILDQLQGFLTKKLGNDVGVQGAMPLFNKMPNSSDDSTAPAPELSSSKSSSSGGKSYLTSWRKLRSKNSGAGTMAPPPPRDGVKDCTHTMSSLPMTSIPSSHAQRKNIATIPASGPNANYMNALVRLFDASQVLDQIACQVEDPGLKHSSQTHVGLELSTRHAADFFGFYICRFVLNDIGIMLDKFIKRGSEWVLI
ncbi:hypothetical protein FQN54_000946 [Arachnomyces sp. PD_36]|nr:hypothetical protein FQN54_000946 [Arachnomyces sp. PD_36]